MTESRDQAEDVAQRVHAAVDEFRTRLSSGEAVEREAFLQQHSEIASELRQELAGLLDRDAARAETFVGDASDSTPDVPVDVDGHGREVFRAGREFGRYVIKRLLGRGAMGTVYLADDTHLDREVAIKIPIFTESHREELQRRFEYEAKAAATLEHPGVCPVYDFGDVDGTHFLAMAYVSGLPLDKLLADSQAFREADAATLMRQLCDAVHVAHKAGIIHRDLKPANVMIRDDKTPVVMDFGLACRMGTDDPRLRGESTDPASTAMVGTPAYMPPEQIRGGSECLGPSADQYSLGVVFYQLLTGSLPFQGTVAQVIHKITADPFPDPRVARPGLDNRLAEICLRMTQPETQDRYKSLAEVVLELDAFLEAPTVPDATPDAYDAAAGSGEPKRPPTTVLVLVGIIVLLSAAVVTLLVTR